MSSGRRNVRNLAINWSSFALTGSVLFFLSPLVLHSLGAVEYGLWSLLNVLTGYLGIMDLGIRASIGRHIFLYVGREDHDAVDETIRTGLGIFTGVGVFILAAAVLFGWAFPHAFPSVPQEHRSLLIWLMPLMALSVWTSSVAAIFSSVLAAHERFDLACGVDVATLSIRALGTIVVLRLGLGMVGLAFVVVGCNILAMLAAVCLARGVYERLQLWPLLMNRLRLRELGGYGIAAFLSAVSVKVIGQTDLIIVGAATDIATVTIYSVGAMLVYYSQSVISQIGITFQPSLQKAVARAEMGSARWIFFRQVRLSSLLGIPMYVGFIMYSEPFIRLWMWGPKFGDSAVGSAALVMSILAGSKLLTLFFIGSGPLLAAMGNVRFNATISISEALANLGISLLFVMMFNGGLLGVAWGTFCSRLLVMTFLLPWYACRKAKIDWWSYLIQIGGRGVVAGLLFVCVCLAAQTLVPCRSWLTFALSVSISLIMFMPVALLVLLPDSDRIRVQNELRLFWT